MKKLNKFAAALAAMVMALSFAGCSDNEEKDSGFDPSKVSVPKGSTELMDELPYVFWGKINNEGVISGSDLKTVLGYMFYDDNSSDSGYDDEEEDDDDDYGEYSSGRWFAVSEDSNTLYGYMWNKWTYTKKYWDEELEWYNEILGKDFKTKKEFVDYLKGLSDEELEEIEIDKSYIELIDKYWGASSEAGAIKFTFTKQS